MVSLQNGVLYPAASGPRCFWLLGHECSPRRQLDLPRRGDMRRPSHGTRRRPGLCPARAPGDDLTGRAGVLQLLQHPLRGGPRRRAAVPAATGTREQPLGRRPGRHLRQDMPPGVHALAERGVRDCAAGRAGERGLPVPRRGGPRAGVERKVQRVPACYRVDSRWWVPNRCEMGRAHDEPPGAAGPQLR